MAEYNIEIKRFNGIDYDTCYPITKKENIINIEEELNNKIHINRYEIKLEKNNWEKLTSQSEALYKQTITIPQIKTTDNIIIQIASLMLSNTYRPFFVEPKDGYVEVYTVTTYDLRTYNRNNISAYIYCFE